MQESCSFEISKFPSSLRTSMADITTSKVERFSLRERLVHWTVALTFLYAALTGLSLWSPRLYWLAAVFGGGVTVRAWHPLGGLIFIGDRKSTRLNSSHSQISYAVF